MSAAVETISVNHASGRIKTCPGYYVTGKCHHCGASFRKLLFCGREWCPTCGQKNSVPHLRRVARWLPKAFQIKSMGYFVFTIPEEARPRFRNKRVLSYLMKYATTGENKKKNGAIGILRNLGFERGLARWHWFGDRSTKFNPHLNVLVDGGKIPHSTLRKIKSEWARLLGVNTAIVHYQYRTTPGEKYHSVNYITRPTFSDYSWDEELASLLYNFRNTRYWGSWDKEPVWKLEEGKIDFETMFKFEKGICPFCNGHLHWFHVQDIRELETEQGQLLPITPGYYLRI